MALLTMIGIGFLCNSNQPKIAYVDTKEALSRPAILLSKSGMDKSLQEKILRRYSALLSEVITAYGKEHKLTIINATMLTRDGGFDITDEIIAKTIEKVRQNG